MRFASLGSGSRGNSLVVEAGVTRILVDCGFSTRSTLERLSRLGVDPGQIDGILVTHEHGDHVAGVGRLATRFNIPVFLTHGTHVELLSKLPIRPEFRLIDSHASLVIGDIGIQPFPVPHDAREPVQYVFSNGVHHLGVLTDCGSITPHVIKVLQRCDGLVLECNHDTALLAASSYPKILKDRITGDFGHLANDQAAALLARVECHRLQHLVAAHLSEENNRPELAAKALSAVLGCHSDWIGVATQNEGIGWRQFH